MMWSYRPTGQLSGRPRRPRPRRRRICSLRRAWRFAPHVKINYHFKPLVQACQIWTRLWGASCLLPGVHTARYVQGGVVTKATSKESVPGYILPTCIATRAAEYRNTQSTPREAPCPCVHCLGDQEAPSPFATPKPQKRKDKKARRPNLALNKVGSELKRNLTTDRLQRLPLKALRN